MGTQEWLHAHAGHKRARRHGKAGGAHGWQRSAGQSDALVEAANLVRAAAPPAAFVSGSVSVARDGGGLQHIARPRDAGMPEGPLRRRADLTAWRSHVRDGIRRSLDFEYGALHWLLNGICDSSVSKAPSISLGCPKLVIFVASWWCLQPHQSVMYGEIRTPDPCISTLDVSGMLQGEEDSQLLLNIAIAVPLVMEPTDNRVLVCRLDPRSGRASIESSGAGSTHRVVHMTAQAGEPQEAHA